VFQEEKCQYALSRESYAGSLLNYLHQKDKRCRHILINAVLKWRGNFLEKPLASLTVFECLKLSICLDVPATSYVRVRERIVLSRATTEITETASGCGSARHEFARAWQRVRQRDSERRIENKKAATKSAGSSVQSTRAPGEPTFYNLEAENIHALGRSSGGVTWERSGGGARWIRVTTRGRGRGGGEVAGVDGEKYTGRRRRRMRRDAWLVVARASRAGGRGSMDARAKVGRGSSFPRTLLFLLSGK
jgi:hypothetical protein